MVYISLPYLLYYYSSLVKVGYQSQFAKDLLVDFSSCYLNFVVPFLNYVFWKTGLYLLTNVSNKNQTSKFSYSFYNCPIKLFSSSHFIRKIAFKTIILGIIPPIIWLILNVSSTNSEQCRLCVNGPLYIDARLLWEQAIGSNCP